VSADERGRYRIFGLTPGEYVVAAMPTANGVPARALTDADVDAALKGVHVATPAVDPAVSYAPVYFPGTAREGDAQTITLAVGEERDGIDIRVEQTRNAGVDGVVTSADGQPVQNVLVMLASAGGFSPLTFTSAARVLQDGRFTFANVRPGSYTLIAQSAGPQASQFAMLSLEVAGNDVPGLQLMMRPALKLAGRIVFEGTAQAPSPAGRSIPLQPLTPGMPLPSQMTRTTEAGAFTLTNVMPGRYKIGGPIFFGATSDSVTWALQSVAIDGVDVTDMPFEIKADAPPTEIVVTYGDRWQELSGRLQQSSGAPAPGYTVIVFPADKAYWMAASRRILTVHPGTDGRFTFGGPGPNTLPPGDYLLAAVTDLDRDEQFDPALLQSLRATGVPITLQLGERKTQDLAIK
jgi:protocatechuate 3,4-dioxygenase beta subunit